MKCRVSEPFHGIKSLPPCGGSGLKCKINVPLFIEFGLPPCGGSGLKFPCYGIFDSWSGSPSVWREWIEIAWKIQPFPKRKVSLRVEGVD